ncbi:MAG TPA: hypothetical protein VFC63_25230 [Blastocatellia bacterium]|nr:hypothetical protein [Blastocatellia bacterium]
MILIPITRLELFTGCISMSSGSEEDYFAVQVTDFSLRAHGILPGHILIGRRVQSMDDIKPGQLVVSVITNQDKFIAGHFFRESDDQYSLRTMEPGCKPIICDPDYIEPFGVVPRVCRGCDTEKCYTYDEKTNASLWTQGYKMTV